MGNFEKSLELLKKAYANFPDAEVAAHLGEVLWAIGLKEEAMEIWKKGLEKQPESQILQETLSRLEVQL